jgi:hypothetical protein
MKPFLQPGLQGMGAAEVLRMLSEAVRSNDKNARQALVSLLVRLFFFEELPPESMQLVVPLFQASVLATFGWWLRVS